MSLTLQPGVVARPELAEAGQRKIEWVRRNMPLLNRLEQEFRANRPFAGKNIVVCVHLEAKTAYLALVLAAGGARVAVTGSNPDSTKDDVVAALDALGLHVAMPPFPPAPQRCRAPPAEPGRGRRLGAGSSSTAARKGRWRRLVVLSRR